MCELLVESTVLWALVWMVYSVGVIGRSGLLWVWLDRMFFFFFQAEDGIRDLIVTGVQTCALPIWLRLRPGPGFASLAELWLRWGRLAALHHGRRARPGLLLGARIFGPVTCYAVRDRKSVV